MSCCCPIPVEPLRFATIFCCDFQGNFLWCRDRGGNSKDVALVGDNILEGSGGNIYTRLPSALPSELADNGLYHKLHNLTAVQGLSDQYPYYFPPPPATDSSWDGASLGMPAGALFDIEDQSSFTLWTPDASESVLHFLPKGKSARPEHQTEDGWDSQYRLIAQNADAAPYMLFLRTVFSTHEDPFHGTKTGVWDQVIVVVHRTTGAFIKTLHPEIAGDCNAAPGAGTFTSHVYDLLHGQPHYYDWYSRTRYRQVGTSVDVYPDNRRALRDGRWVVRFDSDAEESLRLYEDPTTCNANNIPSSVLVMAEYNSGGGSGDNATFHGPIVYDETNDRYVALGFIGIGSEGAGYDPGDIKLCLVVWDATTLEPSSFGQSTFDVSDLTASTDVSIHPFVCLADIDGDGDNMVIAINGNSDRSAAGVDDVGNWILLVDITDPEAPSVTHATQVDEPTLQLHMLTGGECLAYSGTTLVRPYDTHPTAQRVCLKKYDAAGAVLWDRGLSAEGVISRIIIQDAAGYAFIAGSWNVVHDARNHQRHVARIGMDDGCVLWSATRLPVPGGRGGGYIADMIDGSDGTANKLILCGTREPSAWTLFEDMVCNTICAAVQDYDCDGDNDVTGGCCLGHEEGCYNDGAMVSECECIDAGGEWLGQGVACDVATTGSCLPCDNEKLGGCCTGTGDGCSSMLMMTECDCMTIFGGVWLGEGVACDQGTNCQLSAGTCCGPAGEPFDASGCMTLTGGTEAEMEAECTDAGGTSFFYGMLDCEQCGCGGSHTGSHVWMCTGGVWVYDSGLSDGTCAAPDPYSAPSPYVDACPGEGDGSTLRHDCETCAWSNE